MQGFWRKKLLEDKQTWKVSSSFYYFFSWPVNMAPWKKSRNMFKPKKSTKNAIQNMLQKIKEKLQASARKVLDLRKS